MTRGPHIPTWGSYTERFREDAHQLLVWGYSDTRAQIKPDQEETTITCHIADAIEDRLSATTTVTPKRYNRYSVKVDNPVRGEGREGKSRRRLDIIVELTTIRPRPRYVFKAKRLSSKSHPIGKYTGDDGVLRFIESRYAADCPEAAMVGYVQSDDAGFWNAKLQGEFDADTANRFRIQQKLRRQVVLASLPDEWLSRHGRTTGSPIFLYHIFLDCKLVS